MKLSYHVRQLNLRLKLIGSVVIAFLTLLIISALISIASIRQLGISEITNRAAEEQLITDQRFKEVEANLISEVRFLATQPQLADAIQQNDRTLVNSIVNAINTSFPYDSLTVMDVDGAIVFGSMNVLRTDFSLLRVSAEKDGIASRMIVTNASTLIVAATPIRDTDEKRVGIILVADNVDSAFMKILNFERSNMALVLFTNSTLPGISADEASGHPHLNNSEVETLRAKNNLLAQIGRGESVTISGLIVRGTPHTVIYQPLVIGKQPAGYYVLALDEAQPRAVQSRILTVASVTVLVASIVIALLMTRILNHLIIQPLDHLSGVANKLAAGHLTTRANVISQDEVGQLGIAFNQMAAKIEIRTHHLDELNQTLEARVEARTAEVQQQSTWLEAILAAAQEAIIVTDEDHKISLINQSALNIIGLTEAEVLNTHLSNILEPTSEKLVDNIVDSDYGYHNEIELKGRYYHYSISPLSKVLPNQKGDVCILADITALRRLDALKTQVIRMASHDIRSPITSLRLQIYLLKKSIAPLNESNSTTLDRIDSTIQELTRMVNDLLDLERIERQANNICEVINIRVLLDSALSILQTDAEAKQLEIEIRFPSDLPAVCGDPVQLLEVIRNLLTNAIKYTPAGGQIKIEGYHEQQHICLTVKDNGIGIGKDDIKHIFTPHFRAKTALASSEEGHGIGLSLVKAIVEQHGGEVWVESQSGLGSSFGFTLPINISYTTTEK